MKPAVLLGMIRGADTMAAALLHRADLELITLYPATNRILAAKSIPHRTLDDFVDDAARGQVLREARDRVQCVVATVYGPDMRREWTQFDDQTWSALTGELTQRVQRDLPEEILIIEALRRCASETDFRLIMVSEDISRDTRTAITAAHQYGVPALHILHGFPYGTTNGHDMLTANVIAAYSERAKRIYESFGAEPSRVFVTGNPAWDIYCRPPFPGTKEAVCARLGLDPTRPIIEYALTNIHRFSAVSTRHPLYHLQIAAVVLDAFARLSKSHPDWQFVLRPHPGDDTGAQRLTAMSADMGMPTTVVDLEPIHDVLAAVDVLLCTHSNVGIEALLYGKPVINVAIESLAGPVFREGMGPLFLEDDAVLWVRKPEEIAPLIEAALLDPKTRERLDCRRPSSLRQFNDTNDGQATARVCDLALRMIADGHLYVRPVERYPEFEPAILEALPKAADRVLVLGHASRHLVSALNAILPKAEVCQERDYRKLPSGTWDVALLSDPVRHEAAAEELFVALRNRLSSQGVLVAAFRNGTGRDAAEALSSGKWIPRRIGGLSATSLGEFSLVGLRLLLSRAEFDEVSLTEVPAFDRDTPVLGWVVRARRRNADFSGFAKDHRDRQVRAAELNRRGEKRYADGDVSGAVADFLAAVNEWNREALYFNNLGAALHALQQSEQAYEMLVEALHHNPNLQTARANLRMVAHALGRSESAEQILQLFGADAP